MKKMVLFLFALLLSACYSVSFAQSPVILDFSTLTQDDNQPDQQGWKSVAPIMDKVAAAKYFVIETEGVGDNANGFGGIRFIVQGGDGVNPNLEWTEVKLNGDWVNFPRAEGKTVSIAINIQNVLGDNYDSFIHCTDWAQLFIYYYPGAFSTAFEALGFTNAYLTTDFEKPASAVDLPGGTDYGFIFSGSVLPPPPSASFDFNADNIGKTYPIMHAWGWPEDGSSATVAADPLGVNGNSLDIVAGSNDGVVYFPVTLPDGFTVADITGFQFDSYFGDVEAWEAVELFMATANAPVGNGADFKTNYPVYLKTSDGGSDKLQVSSSGEWYTVSITRAQINDPTFNKNGNVPDFSAIDGLSTFLFGVGVSVNAGTEYYMDNIKLVLDNGTDIKTVTPLVTKAYGTVGGIVVNANNEKVSVYSIDGRLVSQTIVNGFNTQISLTQGIYVVKVGVANPVKVIVR